MKRCIRLSLVISLVAIVSACSGPSHVLVKKEHFEAADQCLLIQQSALAANRDHEHIAETLALLRESLELQRRGDSAVREFLGGTPPNDRPNKPCPSLEVRSRFHPFPLASKVGGSGENVLLSV